MVIDFHTHLWDPNDTPDGMMAYFRGRGMDVSGILTGQALIQSMDEAGIDQSVILSNALTSGSDNAYFHKQNAYVYRQVQMAPDRFCAFCTVDPHDVPAAVKELEYCVERKGARGLKLHPNIQQFFPSDNKLGPLYECLEAYGLPVLFHTGGIGIVPFQDSYGAVEHIDELACVHPGLQIVMGHCGRGQYRQAAIILRKHKNVYADISANFSRLTGCENLLLLELLQQVKLWCGNTDRLFFGSDYPYYGQEQTRALLTSLVDETAKVSVTQKDIEGILGGNAERYLRRSE